MNPDPLHVEEEELEEVRRQRWLMLALGTLGTTFILLLLYVAVVR